MSLSLTNKQKSPLSLIFKDADGNPAVGVTGVPVWTSSDESIAVLTVAEDGLSAVITTVDAAVGSIQVTAVLGNLTATLDIDVADEVPVTGNAVSSEIVAGAPESK